MTFDSLVDEQHGHLVSLWVEVQREQLRNGGISFTENNGICRPLNDEKVRGLTQADIRGQHSLASPLNALLQNKTGVRNLRK